MWLFSRVCWDLCLWGGLTDSTGCLPSRGTTSPCVARGPQDPEDLALCSSGFVLPTRALPGIELQSFRLCVPPVYRVLMELKPSPFSFFFVQSLPSSCFRAGAGEGCFPTLSTPSLGFCVNPQISFLGMKDGLVLIWVYFRDERCKKNLSCCSAILALPPLLKHF